MDLSLRSLKGLMRFFEEFDFGVLTSRNVSIGVWRTDGAFFYFDSHSLDEKGINAGSIICYQKTDTVLPFLFPPIMNFLRLRYRLRHESPHNRGFGQNNRDKPETGQGELLQHKFRER